jgi:predicted phage terminase large subunit-like protein
MRYEPRRYSFPVKNFTDGYYAEPPEGPKPAAGGGDDAEMTPAAVDPFDDLVGAFRASYAEEMELAREDRRDLIRPTPLQAARPGLVDGPGGSGRSEAGQPLWPERFDADTLTAWEAALGPEEVPGQFQQRPAARGGGLLRAAHFRRFLAERRLVHEHDANGTALYAGGRPVMREHVILVLRRPDGLRRYDLTADCKLFQVIDTAMTAETTSAYTVALTAALTPDADLCVWDVFRHRILVPYQFDALMKLRAGPCLLEGDAATRVGAWPRELMFQAVENKASGIGLIQQGVARGRPFRVLNAGRKDKVERAQPLAAMYAAGKVYHRADAPWLPDFEAEMVVFPNGRTADQADCMAYAALQVEGDPVLRDFLTRGDGMVIDENPVPAPAANLFRSDADGERFVWTDSRGNPVEIDFGD